MNLAAKASAADAGYAMAALLVAMSVMAIMLSAAMPTWSQMIRREKEAELVFRGEQYARAINQYQRKFANASPATLDVLIEQRLLRKKFKDPLSPNKDGEFQMLYQTNQPTGGQTQGQSQGRGQAARGSGSGTGSGMSGSGGSIGPSPSGRGQIVGVASKNTGQSLRLYKGKNKYNEWQFIGMEMSTQAGAGAAGAGRGGRCPDGSPGQSVTRGGSTFVDCRTGGSGLGGRDGGRGGGFGGRGQDRGFGPAPGTSRPPASSPQR